MDVPELLNLPGSGAPRRALRRRHLAIATLVGRLSLWTVTATMAAFPLLCLAPVIWWLGHYYPAIANLDRWFVLIFVVCFSAAFFTLFVLQRFLVPPRDSDFIDTSDAIVHAALTSYNDEACIGIAVREWTTSSLIDKVIVCDNNSKDRSAELARAAGADEVIVHTVPGYGSCCMRALEAAAEGLGPGDIILLCEGDLTFVATDVAKFLAFIENCDLVLGTRATQELRDTDTQMDWLMNPCNQLVAKLMQVRFWGVRLTDVGCTYRAIRWEAYQELKPHLHVLGNHFSPHMFMEALKLRMRVIEIPIVFRKRGGFSKGVGSNKWKATKVATRMLVELFRI